MMQIRVPERVMSEIERRDIRTGSAPAGGLLIGYRIDTGYWVERALACRNADSEGSGFRIDEQVIRNVSGTLASSGLSVLGSYVVTTGELNGMARQPIGPVALWLWSPGRRNGTQPRAWALDGMESLELALEVVPTPLTPPLICPE